MNFDVIVCGGGVAGSMAAISAARAGAKTLLIERGGCIGGMWTAGLLGITLDADNKGGLLREFLDRLNKEMAESGAAIFEAQKVLLEQMCVNAEVKIMLHTQVFDCIMEGNKLIGVQTASKSGKQSFFAKVIIDATGDGDIAAMAGCTYDYGREEDGKAQPMSMLCVVAGLKEEEIRPYIGYPQGDFWAPRERMLRLLKDCGTSSSMGFPSFSKINDSLFYLSVNHEYEKSSLNAFDITEATIHARREINDIVKALHQHGGEAFQNISLAITPEVIGIREGRRIKGKYTVVCEDMLTGKKHADSVCTASYWVDIHALSANGNKSFTSGGITVKPYDIPFTSLIPIDCDNLILAGRSISGDFYSHASYRVIGNMAPVGEAAGIMAAVCAQKNIDVQALKWEDFGELIPNAASNSTAQDIPIEKT